MANFNLRYVPSVDLRPQSGSNLRAAAALVAGPLGIAVADKTTDAQRKARAQAAIQKLRLAEQRRRLALKKKHAALIAKIAASKTEAREHAFKTRYGKYKTLKRLQSIRDEREFIQNALDRGVITAQRSAQMNKELDKRVRVLLSKQGYSKLSTAKKARLVVIHRAMQAGQISKANADTLVQQAVPEVTGDWTEAATAASTEPAVVVVPEVVATQDLAVIATATAADPGTVPSSTFTPASVSEVSVTYAAGGTAPAASTPEGLSVVTPEAVAAVAASAAEISLDSEELGEDSEDISIGEDEFSSEEEPSEKTNLVLYGGIALAALGVWYWLSSRPTVIVHT